MLVAFMMLGACVFVEPAPFDVFAVALALLLLVGRGLRVRAEVAVALVLLFVFGLSNVVTLVIAKDQQRGLVFAGVTFYLMALWGLIVAIQGRRGARATDVMLWGYVVGAGIAALVAIPAYFGGPFASIAAPNGRLKGFFKDANVFGPYLVPAVMYALVHLGARRHRLAWASILVVCGAAIVLTFSRGSWVNCAVATVVLFVLFTFADGLSRVWWRTMLIFVSLALVLGITGFYFLELPEITDMLGVRARFQGYDTVRFAVQAEALESAAAHPLGQGPGATESVTTISAHNIYIRALLENGIVGALALFAFMAISASRALWISVASRDYLERRRFAVIAASLMGMYVEGSVIDTVHWRHLWLFLAFAWTPTLVASRPPLATPVVAARRG